jgi:hypothetical protein
MKNLLAQGPTPTEGVDIGKEFWLRHGLGISNVEQYKTLGGIVSILLKNAYIIAGVLLFGLLLFGGFGIIMGAGGGDPKKTAQGQQAVTSALIGFLIIFASYWIIQIIQVITGMQIFKPGF